MRRLRCAASSIAAMACALGAALIALPGVAQESPLKFRLAEAVTWDGNVFRVPDTVSDPLIARGLTGRADRITATTIGLNFDKTYSQQQLSLDLSQTATRYAKFNSLDLDAFAYRAAWQWHLTPRISGSFNAERNETLVDFVDTLGVQRISRLTTSRGVSVDGWLFGGWHLIAGASKLVSLNSAVFAAQPSSSQDIVHLGVRYITSAQSSIGYTRRIYKGVNTGQAVDLVNFIDSEFTTQDDELSATWIASAKSTLNGRLTRTERREPHFPQRNFSGVSGEVLYAWRAAGSLNVNLSATRSVIPFAGSLDSSYRVDNTLAVVPIWQVGAHTTLRLNAYRRTADFLGSVNPAGSAARRDIYRVLEVGASWVPHRTLTLGATLRRESRTSTGAGLPYEATVAGVTGALTF